MRSPSNWAEQVLRRRVDERISTDGGSPGWPGVPRLLVVSNRVGADMVASLADGRPDNRVFAAGRSGPGAVRDGLVAGTAPASHADLANADLSGADLTGATLTGTNLAGATLSEATCPDGKVWEGSC
jgi:hypothetical protein